MRLKTLEILGFKTFAERTVVEFSPEQRITAIIGPNGCGKSNLVDAIRWVMGEQSVRLLRGSAHDEIIFSGSLSAKPLSLADASLTFENSDRYLPLDFSEVNVRRRVYRSGESEFYINKAGCRLKDIQRLFMDTGIGRNSYAIINQGQIDAILNAKPEDRRAIFEEVAGVNKYRSQKNEALNKLASTEANLIRVADLCSEIKNQIAPLRTQAEKAEHYQKLKSELQKIEVNLLSAELLKINKKQEKNEEFLKSSRQKLLEVDEKLKASEAEKSKLFQEAHLFEDKLNARRNEIVETRKEIEKNRAEQTINEERQNYLMERTGQLNQELELLQKENLEIEAELEKFGTFETGQNKELKTVEEELSKLRKVHQKLTKDYQVLVQEIDALNNSFFNAEREISQKKNLLITLDSNKKIITQEAGRDLKFFEEGGRKLKNTEEKILGLTREEVELKKKLATARVEGEKLKEELVAVLNERKQIEAGSQKIRDELSGLDSRIEIFRDFSKRKEELTAIIEQAFKNGQISGKFYGVFSQLLKVPGHLKKALKAVLGERLSYLVVDELETALKINRFLKENNLAARVGFLVNSLFEKKAVPNNISGSGVLGRLSSLVEINSEFKPILAGLLDEVLVVENEENFPKINLEIKIIATLKGEIFYRPGTVVFGEERGILEPGIEAGEVKVLEKADGDLRTKLNELLRKKEESEIKIADLEKSIKEKEIFIRLEEAKNKNISSEKLELEAEYAGLKNDFDLWDKNLENRKQEITRIEEEREHCLAEINFLVRKKNELELTFEEKRELIKEIEEEKNKAGAELNDFEINSARLSGRYSHLKEQLDILNKRRSQVKEQINLKENELNSATAKLTEAKKSQKFLAETMPVLLKKETELVKAGQGFDQNRQKIQANYQKIDQTISKIQEEKHLLENEISEIKIRLAEIEVSAETIKDRLQSEYEINADNVNLEEYVVEDAAEVKAQVEKLRREIHRLEPVNLMAIEELKTHEERLGFLESQKQDLMSAKDNLTSLIRKLDQQAKKDLLESIKEVNSHFARIFAKIFMGGEAQLVPADESDILNSGIEIVVQMPGKRRQNLTLLSGGERALTSAALLFAMLEARPAPFCVLDEVDAALDESNVDRFVELLKEYSQKSQIIIITHSRRTIANADVIYGVTMETPGISKIVSIKLNKVEEVLKDDREAN